MSDKSTIEWTEATWNPVTGCSKVSPGCAHCYAERLAPKVFAGQVIEYQPGHFRARAFTDVRTHPDRLDQPLRWRRPRRVFVNSLSDLFHEDVPDAFIDQVFAVMALAPQHTFQVLTKRAVRMGDYVRTLGACPDRRAHRPMDVLPMRLQDAIAAIALSPKDPRHTVYRMPHWPLPNVWLGVSVENQHFANERIPLLLKTPAAVRFISAEPLLERVLLDNGETSWLTCTPYNQQREGDDCCMTWLENGDQHFHGLDWVIVGGESGPGARPFEVSWARSIVSEGRRAGVPVFVKQLGADPRGWCNWPPHDECPPQMLDEHGTLTSVSGRPGTLQHAVDDAFWPCSPKLRDRKGADMTEWPADLRVRQFPAVGAHAELPA